MLRTALKVGIKATNIGSLVRQAPWLVLQRIDGQMLPVVRFLRRAGVVDVERVVRAYPRILCANIRGELAPRVRSDTTQYHARLFGVMLAG